ncbi:MAG: hypothetical protein V2J25_02910 [Desulfatiglans sp.]|nr:hypothetical protein [Desulfatiglans sp.]
MPRLFLNGGIFSPKPVFQIICCHLLAPYAECQSERQGQRAESHSECRSYNLLSNTQLYERNGAREDNNGIKGGLSQTFGNG